MTHSVDTTDLARARLEQWGYDDGFEAAFRQIATPGDRPGRILRADSRACLVAHASGEGRFPVGRRLVSDGEHPTTGDWIVLGAGGDSDAERGAAVIVDVVERRSAVTRASADPGRGVQVLAANVDTVLVAEPLGERWRPRRLERLLVVAWQSGALPVVVLTKADRSDDAGAAIATASAVAPGVAVHAVSPLTGEGMAELAAELAPGSTAVIIGRSGAGKSTLTNSLSGGVAELATAEVRGDGKGRHTTVTRELVRLANGALLIDTPGVRSIGLVDADDAIADAFTDIESLVGSCRFNDCGHDGEPDCAVAAAIASGQLDAARLDSYRRLQRDQERLEAREDKRLQAERAAAFRRRSRMLKQQPHR